MISSLPDLALKCMLNRLASLAMSISVLKALSGKLDIKRHSPSIHYVLSNRLVLFIYSCTALNSVAIIALFNASFQIIIIRLEFSKCFQIYKMLILVLITSKEVMFGILHYTKYSRICQEDDF